LFEKRYDIDGSGSIDINELKRALESMGQNPSDEEVEIIFLFRDTLFFTIGKKK